jgi:kinesin family protein 11
MTCTPTVRALIFSLASYAYLGILGLEEHSRLKRIRLDTTASLHANVEASSSYIQSSLTLRSSEFESYTHSMSTHVSDLQELTAAHGDEFMRGLSTMHETATTLLDHGTREDMSTGETPKKKQWKYTDHWKLAKPREQLLGQPQPLTMEETPEPEDLPPQPEAGSSRLPTPRQSGPRTSDIENRAPPVQEPPPPQALPRPVKKESIALPPLSLPMKAEEREVPANPVPMVESRRRNVSNRFRRP